MKRCIFFVAGLLILTAVITNGQDKPIRWSRTAESEKLDLQLFHSTHAIALPTAETHQKGDFEFEISHRFIPPIDDGFDELYGLDGPVNMRIALGFALTNRWLVTLGRSNRDDNLDLWSKYKAFQFRSNAAPAIISLRGGLSWSPIRLARIDDQGNLVYRHRDHKRNFQYYGQIIINSMIAKKVGLGLVPSFLVNREIGMEQWENSFVLGINGQYYFMRHWSLLGEWAVTLTDKFDRHNPAAIGVELETGGHFFKLFVSNQTLLNPSQFLAGAENPFDRRNLRLGFMVTRLL